jgi:pimeloyl-ACP methyl ester carboxylesterase
MESFPKAALIVLGLFCLAVNVLSAQTPAQDALVDVGGHKLNVRVMGTPTPGVPTVVFESGLGSPLDAWGTVPADLAGATKTVAYERAGIGKSEPGTDAPTIRHIATELHLLLTKIDTPPPYLLVGHSYGGPIIHTFAAMFPREIAGLVYVDPTDFTQTDADMLALWEQAGNKNGRDELRKMQEKIIAAAPAGVQAEAREVDRVERGGFTEFREAGEAPDVPTIVLLAGKNQTLPPGMTFPGDAARWFQASLAQRLDHFQRLAQRGANGTLVMTSKSSHFIQTSEPELVAWAIRRALSSATPHPELERFVGEYPLAPTFAITITRDGDKLFAQATGQPSFQLFAESAMTFSLKVVNAQIEFETNDAGTATALVLVQNGRRQRAPKAK